MTTRCEVCHADDPLTVRLCGACIASAALRVTDKPRPDRPPGRGGLQLPDDVAGCHELIRWHQRRDDEQHAWIEVLLDEVRELRGEPLELTAFEARVPEPGSDPGRRNGATRPRRRRRNGVTVG